MVGLSNVTREHVERARKIVPIASVQNRYSFADREWDSVIDYCEKHGIAFIPWFPLGAGKAAHEALTVAAKAHHAQPLQVALAWLLQRSPVTIPIPGTSSVEHLEQNIAAASVKLTPDEFRKLSNTKR
jgi:pyridoxine 4-dehydrogenase